MRLHPLVAVLMFACLAIEAGAAPSALSRLPDDVVQRLRERVSTRADSPARQALRNRLDDLGQEVDRDDAATRHASAERRAEREQAAKRRAASQRVEIQQLRDQVQLELAELKSQVEASAGAGKAAEVATLISQVNARFERLDLALQRVEQADGLREIRAARRALNTLLDSLREPAQQMAAAPIPMLKMMPHRVPSQPVLPRPGAAVPAYVQDMRRDQAPHEHRYAGGSDDDRIVSFDPDSDAHKQGFGLIKASVSQPVLAPDAAADCNSVAADLADDGIDVRANAPEIQALAKSLQYSPVRILRWMLKEVAFQPYWGSLKGSLGVLQTRKGNATDQSSLLIALLRASNVPARYVRGYVDLYDPQPTDNANGRAQRWLGTKTYAGSTFYLSELRAFGIPKPYYADSQPIQGIQFEHVWVEACVPYSAYRGTMADAGGYRWLPLDPSIKDHDYQAGLVVNVPLDEAFYSGYMDKRRDQLPTEYLAGKVDADARLRFRSQSVDDVPYRGALRSMRLDVLPSAIPGKVEVFSNWPGTSSPETAVLPDAHRHKFSVTVGTLVKTTNAAGAIVDTLQPLATQTVTFPQDVFKRLTVSYAPDAASQSLWNSWGGSLTALPAGSVRVYPQIKLDGRTIASGSGAATLALGAQHILMMKVRLVDHASSFSAPEPASCIADPGVMADPQTGRIPPDPDRHCLNKTVYDNIKAGGYFALGVNAAQTSDALLESRAQSLAQAVRTHPSAPTPASGGAYDATVGELLELVLQTYIDKSEQAEARIAELLGHRSNGFYDIGLTGADIQTSYVFDLPLTVKPAGPYVDFKGGQFGYTKIASAIPLKANPGESPADHASRAKAVRRAEHAGLGKLTSYARSALEHQVWQEALRTDAVSTVRGMQFAAETGISIVTLTQNNIAQYDSLMQMSGPTSMAAYKTSITAEVEAGATVTVPRAQIAYTDPVDPTKAWRGAVYKTDNDRTGGYGAIINGSISGGFPLINQTPYTNIYAAPPVIAAPTFVDRSNAGQGRLLTLAPGTQGSNNLATWAGDPVNMLTGNFVHHETDFHIKGRGGLPIVLERWYNSGDPKDGPMGYGWTHSLNHVVKLYGVEGGVAKLSWVNGSGGENFFTTTSQTNGNITAGTTLVNPPGVEIEFSRIAGGADDGKFSIRERDGTTYLFASATGPNVVPSATSAVSARMLSITDRNGNSLTLNYSGTQLSSVTDSLNRTVLSFTWTGSHITQVSDFTGRTVKYAYTDGNNNLNQVTDVANRVFGYSYYTSVDGAKQDHHLKRYTLPRGNGMEFEYYSGGQVFRHTAFDTRGQLIDNGAMTFHYNLFTRESWSVNERGYKHHTTFDSYGNPLRIVNEAGAAHSYTYDAAQPYNRLSETDSIGRVTRYTYTTASPKNLIATQTLPSGTVLEFSDYNRFAQPQRLKDARGNWTWQGFDAKGNLTDSIRVARGVTPVAGSQPAAADILAWSKTAYDSVGNPTTSTRVKDFSAGTGPSMTMNWSPDQFSVTSLTRRGNRNGALVVETSPTFSYDALGRLKTGVDARWYPIAQDYDALGRVIQATDALGKVHKFSFDANGNPTGDELVEQGVRVDHTARGYDARDRVADILDHAGNRSYFAYDAVGNRIRQTSADNFSIGIEYDAANRPVAAFDAEENRVFTDRDTEGRPVSVTDPNNNKTLYQYGGLVGGKFLYDGRLVFVEPPRRNNLRNDIDHESTRYAYDAAGSVVITGAVRGLDLQAGQSNFSSFLTPYLEERKSYSFYDELGRMSRSVGKGTQHGDTGDRLQLCSKYDNLSNLLELWAGPTTDTTSTKCDFTDVNLKRQVSYSWDDFGQQLSKVDQLNRTWTYRYDLHGNLSTSQSPEQAKLGQQTSFGYDPKLNGLLKTRVVPGSGNAGQVMTYTRNALGQLTRAETRDGNQAQLVAYDYGYDTAHRLANITDSRGNKSLGYAWTPGGRLAKVTLADSGKVTHQWDFKYDAVGRLSAIVAPNGQTVSFALDAGGRLRERSFGNGLTTQYDWFNDGSLRSVVHLVGGTQVIKHAYTYEGWRNRKTATDTVGGVTSAKKYFYDPVDRLTTVSTGVEAEQEGYAFDVFGNLSSKTLGQDAQQSWTYTVDAAHQLKQIDHMAGGTTTTTALLHYDDNGNLKQLCEAGGGQVSGTSSDCTAVGAGSATTTFKWNGLDQLVALAKAGTAALNEAYVYDDAGNRIKKTSGAHATHYVYNGQDILAEWTGASLNGAPAAVYAHGGGTDDPLLRLTGQTGTPQADAKVYAQDGIGSVSALIAGDGSAVTQRFDAWGKVQSSTGTIPTYGYTGREPDASGLGYFRARYYHPGLSRFISRDPIGLAGGINPYAYADGNPLRFNDPSGLLARNAANTVGDYYGSVNNWANQNNVGTRLGGLAQAGFGIGEMAVGAVGGAATSWTGVGALGGAMVIGIGADQTSAGLQTLWTGQATQSMLDRGMDAAGTPPLVAATVGVLVSPGGGAPKVAANVEQYALRAAESGFYPVMTRGSKEATALTWLEKGDVWKFGTTKNPTTRYSQSFLDSVGEYGVTYSTEFKGTLREAQQLESIKIRNFIFQSNQLPAGNKIIR